MALTLEEVDKIAKLARLKFDEGEKQKLQHDLTNILDYVDQIKSLGDKAEVVLVEDPDAVNLTRDDIPLQVENPDKFLDQAPGRDGDFVKVKSVLE
jgi:aspartyl-tRNA(Asn)/glutamyl-tRNA(Gln) amidotransferase subunit C